MHGRGSEGVGRDDQSVGERDVASSARRDGTRPRVHMDLPAASVEHVEPAGIRDSRGVPVLLVQIEVGFRDARTVRKVGEHLAVAEHMEPAGGVGDARGLRRGVLRQREVEGGVAASVASVAVDLPVLVVDDAEAAGRVDDARCDQILLVQIEVAVRHPRTVQPVGVDLVVGGVQQVEPAAGVGHAVGVGVAVLQIEARRRVAGAAPVVRVDAARVVVDHVQPPAAVLRDAVGDADVAEIDRGRSHPHGRRAVVAGVGLALDRIGAGVVVPADVRRRRHETDQRRRRCVRSQRVHGDRAEFHVVRPDDGGFRAVQAQRGRRGFVVAGVAHGDLQPVVQANEVRALHDRRLHHQVRSFVGVRLGHLQAGDTRCSAPGAGGIGYRVVAPASARFVGAAAGEDQNAAGHGGVDVATVGARDDGFGGDRQFVRQGGMEAVAGVDHRGDECGFLDRVREPQAAVLADREGIEPSGCRAVDQCAPAVGQEHVAAGVGIVLRVELGRRRQTGPAVLGGEGEPTAAVVGEQTVTGGVPDQGLVAQVDVLRERAEVVEPAGGGVPHEDVQAGLGGQIQRRAGVVQGEVAGGAHLQRLARGVAVAVVHAAHVAEPGRHRSPGANACSVGGRHLAGESHPRQRRGEACRREGHVSRDGRFQTRPDDATYALFQGPSPCNLTQLVSPDGS